MTDEQRQAWQAGMLDPGRIDGTERPEVPEWWPAFASGFGFS